MTLTPGKNSSTRSGFTLFELLVVLGVIVLMAGILWPNLLAFYETSALKDQGRLVGETVAATRLAAIDHGVPYQFLYEPDGTHYLMIPAEGEPVSGEVSEGGAVVTLPGRSGELPENFQFKTPEGVERGSVTVTSDMLDNVPEAEGLSGISWAEPALFYPDGTGISYDFEVEDDGQRYLEFSIRGLTGAARISPMQTRSRK